MRPCQISMTGSQNPDSGRRQYTIGFSLSLCPQESGSDRRLTSEAPSERSPERFDEDGHKRVGDAGEGTPMDGTGDERASDVEEGGGIGGAGRDDSGIESGSDRDAGDDGERNEREEGEGRAEGRAG